jgi:hypothetical protein
MLPVHVSGNHSLATLKISVKNQVSNKDKKLDAIDG